MNRPSVKRRPSSGANTGLKWRKSNLGDDDFNDSANISDSLPRQKPGVMSQAYSYGAGCGTTTYTVQGLQQTYDDRKETRNLISETTLDTLRRFRYRDPQAPTGEDLSSGPLNRSHGLRSTEWKESGIKPSHNHNFSLPSTANSSVTHGHPGPPRNATGGTLGPRGVGMTVEDGHHVPVQTYSSTTGGSNSLLFSSPQVSEHRKAAISEQGSPCSDLIYEDNLDKVSNLSRVTEPQGSNLLNSSIACIREIEIPEECPDLCDDEIDEAGLVTLADAYSQSDTNAGVYEATNALGDRSVDREYATPLNCAEQPVDMAHSSGSYAEELDDEYAMDPEYFNYATEAPIQGASYSKADNWNSKPDCETSNDREASVSQVQGGVRDNAVGQNLPLLLDSPNDFTSSTSPSMGSNQSYGELGHTVTYFEEHSCAIHSRCNQGQKTIDHSLEAKPQTLQMPKADNQFIPTGNSVGDNTSSPTNPRRSQPFLRYIFPSLVRNRSHIQGLSSHTVLRTCFRIGEALKAPTPSPSATVPRTTVIELYAVVVASYYSGHTQYFTFADLFFPTRPPYLTGKWSGKNPDSNILNRQDDRDAKDDMGSMCRVIGTISSSGEGCRSSNSAIPAQPMKGMTMTVQGIWRADWDDIEYVKGIVEA